jgi:uroporphyrinogen III methyltransferase / synthase
MPKGKVFLIGAGPGDPGLLTLRGKEILSRADVVVYDALISPRLLEWAKPGAVKIFVGKRGLQYSKEQTEINEILARKAAQGKSVARLKGGDPFLFGRGGEEAAYLVTEGIPFEIIPGVTSASGVAACAGIPLTDRRLASMVTFVTGHEGKGKKTVPVDWARIARDGTLVIFMGLDQLEAITDRLRHHLWHENTPAVAVRWGSTPQQVVVEGTLGDIAAKVREAGLSSPVLVVIGKVVTLRKKLRWFDARPLFGKKIVVTRAAEQAHEFIRILEDMGAEVISFPTIQIVPPKSWAPVDRVVRGIAQYDWILFTSVNGVTMFFARLKAVGGDIRNLKGLRIGAIGPKTSSRLQALGLNVDAFPEEYRAEALAEVIGKVKGQRILLARAEKARDILPKTLEARGAKVTIATVYRTLKPRRLAADVKKRLTNGDIDVVTFTSSSTVDGFMQHFNPRQRRRLFDHSKAAAIGPITADTLRTYGVRPAIRAKRYTIEALAKAIVKYFS